MTIQSVWQKSFDFFGKPVVVEPSETELTSDAGLLPIRQFDAVLGLTEQFAAALTDVRYQPSVQHDLLEMIRMRVFGILADYPDQNDHDVLRSDPVFKLIVGRSLQEDDLASQPTLSRFENAISRCENYRTSLSTSSLLRSTSRRRGSRWISIPSTIPRTASSN